MSDAPPPNLPPHAFDAPPPAKSRRGLRIPFPVVAVLIAAAVYAGAWVLYTQLFVTKKINLQDFESSDSPAATIRGRFFDDGAVVGVVARDNNVEARIIGAVCTCTFDDGKPPRFTYRYSQFPGPTGAIAGLRSSVLADKEEQARAKITPEQLEKVRAVPFPRDVALTDAQRDKLIDLLAKFRAAPEDQRKPLETEILASLRAHAADGLTQTLNAHAAAEKQIREILTVEQYNMLRPRPRRNRQP